MNDELFVFYMKKQLIINLCLNFTSIVVINDEPFYLYATIMVINDLSLFYSTQILVISD